MADTDVGTLQASLELSNEGFVLSVAKAGQQLRQLQGQFDQTADKLARMESAMAHSSTSFSDIVLTMGALRFALMDLDDIFLRLPRSIAETAGHMERMQMLMTGLSDKSDWAQKSADGFQAMAQVMEMAKNSPFDMDTISQGFVRFKAVGLDPATQGLQTLVEAGSKFGASKEQMSEATLAIQEMMAKGVVEMKELRRQLGQAIPEAVEDMAQGVGMSMAELTKATKSGGLEASGALAKMFAQMELSSFGSAERMKQTFTGLTNQMKTSLTLFETQVGNQGFMTEVKTSMKELTEYLNSAQGQELGKSLGEGLRSAAESAAILVKEIVDLTHGVSEFSGPLKIVGEALLAYFGGQRVMSGIQLVRTQFQAVTQAAQLQAQAQVAAQAKVAEGAREEAAKIRAAIEEEISAGTEAHLIKITQLQEMRDLREQSVAEELAEMNELKAAYEAKAGRIIELEYQIASVHRENGRFAANPQRGAMLEEIAALDRERQALLAEGAALNSTINIKGQFIARTDELIAAEGREIAALQEGVAANAAYRETQLARIAEFEGTAASAEKAARGVSAIGIAAGNFAKSLAATSGYMLAFTAGLQAIEWAYNKITASAREAEDAMNRAARVKANQATDKDVKDDSAKSAELLDRIARAQQLKQGIIDGAKTQGRDLTGDDKEYIAQFDAQIETYRAQLFKINEELGQAIAERAATTAQEALAASVQRINNVLETDGSLAQMQTKYEKARQQREDAVKANDQKTLKDLEPVFQKFGRDFTQMRLDVFEKAQAAELAKVSDPNQQALLKEKIQEEREHLSQLVDQVNAPNQFTNEKKDKRDPFADLLAEQQKKLEETRWRMEVAGQEILTNAQVEEHVRQEIKNLADAGRLKDKDGKNIAQNGAQGQQLADAMKQAELAEQGEKAWAGMQSIVTDAKAAITSAGDSFAGAGEKANPALEKFIKQAEEAARVLPETSAQLKTMGQDLNATMADAGYQTGLEILNEQAGKSTSELDKLNLKLQEVGLSAKEKAKLQIQAEIDAINAEEQAAQRSIELLIQTGKLSQAQVADLIAKLGVLNQQGQQQITALQRTAVAESKTASEQLAESWGNVYQNLDKTTAGWIEKLTDQLVTGKFKIRDFAESAMQDLTKISLHNALSGSVGGFGDGLTGALAGLLGGSKGGGTGALGATPGNPMWTTSSPTDGTNQVLKQAMDKSSGLLDQMKSGISSLGTYLSNAFTSAIQWLGGLMESLSASQQTSSTLSSGAAAAAAFANGGIMTGAGPVNLRAYANGGIANSPQLALFGEGSSPEAFVPLPDGRSIPVQMSGGQAANQPPAVTVNVINNSGTQVNASTQGQRFDGRQMVLDVVMEGMNSTGPFRDNMRSAIQTNSSSKK